MVTLQDVADAAGVSKATASRSLQGSALVAEATRLRVEAAAASLDFVPTPSATRLATGRTWSVAIVTPFLERWYFASVLSATERRLRQAGYDVLLVVLPEGAVRSTFFSTMPLRRRVDAVVLLTLTLAADELAAITALPVPVVAVGERHPGVHSVMIDDHAVSLTAVEHLLGLGHRRIVHLGGSPQEPQSFSAPVERRRGYGDALAAAGLDPDPRLVLAADFTVASAKAIFAAALADGLDATAVYAASDEMAMGAMLAAHEAGLDVPRDLSVVGVDDHEIAEPLGLTTVAQPCVEQGELAARRVLDLLYRGDGAATEGESHTLLPTRLLVRASTGAPPHR